MIAYIKNLATYPREVQYYGINQYMVLKPFEQIKVENINTADKVSYYQSLECSGFSVCFHHDNNKCCCEDIKVKHDENLEEGDRSLDFSEFSDEELKRIIQNLNVSTRARARQRLESIISENLPRDKDLRDYL